jgi:hypothetical protein
MLNEFASCTEIGVHVLVRVQILGALLLAISFNLVQIVHDVGIRPHHLVAQPAKTIKIVVP